MWSTKVSVSEITESWHNIFLFIQNRINSANNNFNFWICKVDIFKSDFTAHQEHSRDIFFLNTKFNKFLNCTKTTSARCQHWVQ